MLTCFYCVVIIVILYICNIISSISLLNYSDGADERVFLEMKRFVVHNYVSFFMFYIEYLLMLYVNKFSSSPL